MIAAAHSQISGSASAAVTLAIIVLLLVTRVRGRRLDLRRLIILPAVLVALGFANTSPALHTTTLHSIDYLIGGIDLADSLILGSIRGFTVRIYHLEGNLWYRYGPATVSLWLISILIRIALAIIGAKHHASHVTEGPDLLFMLGLTLLCQNLIVAARSQTSPAVAARR